MQIVHLKCRLILLISSGIFFHVVLSARPKEKKRQWCVHLALNNIIYFCDTFVTPIVPQIALFQCIIMPHAAAAASPFFILFAWAPPSSPLLRTSQIHLFFKSTHNSQTCFTMTQDKRCARTLHVRVQKRTTLPL
jgi:hypothetical protein